MAKSRFYLGSVFMVVSVILVPFLVLLYFCIDFSKCFPASVRRYFCKRLLGLSGMVYSIDFLSISSLMVRLKAPVLLFNPSILVNSLVERGRLPSA